MKMLSCFAFLSIIVSFTILGGMVNTVLAQTNDSAEVQSSNATSNVYNSTSGNPANMSNIVTPAGETNTYR